MSAKTIVASSKVDDALHKVAACAETLSDNTTSHGFDYFEGDHHDLNELQSAIQELKEAEKAMADLVASESNQEGVCDDCNRVHNTGWWPRHPFKPKRFSR